MMVTSVMMMMMPIPGIEGGGLMMVTSVMMMMMPIPAI